MDKLDCASMLSNEHLHVVSVECVGVQSVCCRCCIELLEVLLEVLLELLEVLLEVLLELLEVLLVTSHSRLSAMHVGVSRCSSVLLG